MRNIPSRTSASAVVAEAGDKRVFHDLAFEAEIEYDVVLSLLARTLAEVTDMEGSQLDREVDQGVTVG